MKTNYNYQTNNAGKSSKGSGYYPQRLSIKEAVIWFLLTAIALFLSGTSKSQATNTRVQASVSTAAASNSHWIAAFTESAFI